MTLLRCSLALLTATACALVGRAAPVDTAIVQAMKLNDASNYTWSAEVKDDARTYTIEGKTDRSEDFSRVNMPVIASLRRRLVPGGANSDNVVTAIFKGDEHMVFQATDDSWQTPDELQNGPTPAGQRGRRGGGPGGVRGGARGGARGGTAAYSNLQLSLSRPHDEIAIIIANGENMKASGDTLTGTLSEIGAQLLLVHAGQDEIKPVEASGRFQIWFSGGAIRRYEVDLEGVVEVVTNDLRHNVTVRQNTVTTISAVGTTKFEVPDDARIKLTN